MLFWNKLKILVMFLLDELDRFYLNGFLNQNNGLRGKDEQFWE